MTEEISEESELRFSFVVVFIYLFIYSLFCHKHKRQHGVLINDGGIFLLTEVRRTMGDIGFVREWFHRSSETGVMDAGF